MFRRCCLLTRSLYSLPHPTTLINVSTSTRPNTLYLYSSSFAPTTQGNQAPDTTNSEEDRQLKFIKLEISLLRERGGRAPDINLLKKHHWDTLLTLKTKTARYKSYAGLFLTEKAKKNKAFKIQLRKESWKHQKSLKPQRDDPHITYSVGKVSFLLRIGDSVKNLWRNNRLLRAMQFGEKLIFDCSFDRYMNHREAQNAAKQLTLSFANNRRDTQPFDLHFCNVNYNGETMKQLERTIPTMRNKEFPMNLYEGSYLDLFPREQLVYLTPHCRNVLTDYDPNMIYIIGAMVDKTTKEPLSLAKATELNLKMARLPLEPYLDWGCGAVKSLTLDQMVRIMLDLKRTRDWQIALKHVPTRKVKYERDYQRPTDETFIFDQTKKKNDVTE